MKFCLYVLMGLPLGLHILLHILCTSSLSYSFIPLFFPIFSLPFSILTSLSFSSIIFLCDMQVFIFGFVNEFSLLSQFLLFSLFLGDRWVGFFIFLNYLIYSSSPTNSSSLFFHTQPFKKLFLHSPIPQFHLQFFIFTLLPMSFSLYDNFLSFSLLSYLLLTTFLLYIVLLFYFNYPLLFYFKKTTFICR